MEINAKSKEIIDIENEVEEEVQKFRKTITKGPCQKYFLFQNAVDPDWDNEDVYIDALYQGYLDACRTIHWNSKSNDKGKKLLEEKEEWDDKKEKSTEENPMRKPLKEVAEKLKGNFKEEKNKETFNNKHTEWCKMLIANYSSCLVEELTYGQAQKIINMAFKYLYCIFAETDKFEEKKGKFKYCHMPLDKFSLEWIKRYFSSSLGNEYWKGSKEENFKKGNVQSWSRMEEEDHGNKKYGYNTYSKNIQEYCEQKYDGQISPLQLDFIVWPKMQKIMATEEFIKTFEEDDDKWVQKAIRDEKYDIGNLNEILEKRLIKIRPLICDDADPTIYKKK